VADCQIQSSDQNQSAGTLTNDEGNLVIQSHCCVTVITMETHDTAYHLLEATASHAHADHTDEWHFESPVSEGHFRKTQRLLYTSHFLSTWNSRLFEFGAYLFLAAIYPQTLLPASVYALTRAGSAAIVTPWLGHYVDTGERLAIVRISIGKQALSEYQLSSFLTLLSFRRSTHCRSYLMSTSVSHVSTLGPSRKPYILGFSTHRTLCTCCSREAKLRH